MRKLGVSSLMEAGRAGASKSASGTLERPRLSLGAGGPLKHGLPPSAPSGCRVDDPGNTVHLAARKPTSGGVLAHPVLAGGDIDAEDLAAGDITVIPLDVAAHVGKNLVALLRDAADLLVAERSGPGQLAFDDEWMGMSRVSFGASRDGRCGS